MSSCFLQRHPGHDILNQTVIGCSSKKGCEKTSNTAAATHWRQEIEHTLFLNILRCSSCNQVLYQPHNVPRCWASMRRGGKAAGSGRGRLLLPWGYGGVVPQLHQDLQLLAHASKPPLTLHLAAVRITRQSTAHQDPLRDVPQHCAAAPPFPSQCSSPFRVTTLHITTPHTHCTLPHHYCGNTHSGSFQQAV